MTAKKPLALAVARYTILESGILITVLLRFGGIIGKHFDGGPIVALPRRRSISVRPQRTVRARADKHFFGRAAVEAHSVHHREQRRLLDALSFQHFRSYTLGIEAPLAPIWAADEQAFVTPIFGGRPPIGG